MNKYVLFIKEDGVIGIGTERAYGCDVTYFLDGIEFSATCEPEEYVVMGYMEELD